MSLTNWAGNVVFAPAAYHRPGSLDELRAVVTRSSGLRVLGTGHSFSTIADTPGDLVSLAAMPRRIEVDAGAGTVTVSAGTRYGELAPVLHEAGLALHNLGSLPHIGVAGACSTGTHGSGDRQGVLATAVRALELLTVEGDLLTLTGDDVRTAAVGLGAFGVVTAVTLAAQPTYEIRQAVYDDLAEPVLLDHLDEVFASGRSVSVFLTWRRPGVAEQLWVKSEAVDGEVPAERFGARLADAARHPIPGAPAEFTTEQGGVPGPWFARLPHFRLEFTPSAGEELQSEYLLPREHAAAALAALGAVRERFAHLVQISELRSIAADDLLLSPASGRATVAVHVTWVKDVPAVTAVLPVLEEALAPFGARPHWGKVSTVPAADVRARYPRFEEWAAARERFDPRGVLVNPWLATLLG